MPPSQYYVAGKPSTHVLRFIVDGQYVPADAGSVSFDLRGPTGNIILQDVAVPIADGMTFATVTIPAEHNVKTADVESRFISVSYETSGLSQMLLETYSLIDFIPMTCKPDDVRSLLGLTAYELPNPDIDLVRAYYALKKLDLTTTISDMLFSDLLTANRMIVLNCALSLLPSLQTRTAKQQTSGSESFTRGSVDWAALEARLRSEYDGLLSTVQANIATRVYFTVSTQPDPVYGDDNAS